jgi:peptidoglycan/LPS O-acetylase OafA/YrhL
LKLNTKYINDLRGLDILRFMLSFAVIIWHYQHFFYPFVDYADRALYLEKQPFFNYLSFIYTQGLYAVHMFWFISGVIFHKIYQQKIANYYITIKPFFINRFSRLYPLHVLMLVLVLVLQKLYFRANHSYFIYPDNSTKSFFQNLLFIQSWGSNKFSFNGPTWSVSIEILVYLVFFLIAQSGMMKTLRSQFAVFLFFVVLKKWELVFVSEDIATCFYFFFAGTLFIRLYDKYKSNLQVILTTGLFVFAGLIFSLQTPSALSKIFAVVSGRLDVPILLFTILTTLTFLHCLRNRFFDFIPEKGFHFFGNMTYSMYLVHFPLQLGIYLVLKPTDYTLFFSPKFFLIYLCILLILARIVYILFELNAQNYLRRKFLKQSNA